MRKTLLFLLTCLFLSASALPVLADGIAGFYPPADTIYAGRGCTPPIIRWEQQDSTDTLFRLVVRPGFNTMFSYTDSQGVRQYPAEVFFLISDSTGASVNSLWYKPQYPAGLPAVIPPDSEFFCEADSFLLMARMGTTGDSLAIRFVAEYGLGMKPEPSASGMPLTPEIYPNYPNPFNAATTVRFSLPERAPVRLTVYNVRGQVTAELLNGRLQAGEHRLKWNAENIPSGIYFLRLKAGRYGAVRRMFLMK